MSTYTPNQFAQRQRQALFALSHGSPRLLKGLAPNFCLSAGAELWTDLGRMGMLWVEHDDENDTFFVVFSTEDQAARAEEASKLWVLEDRDSHTTSSIRLEACSVPVKLFPPHVSLRNPRPGHRFWPDTTLDPHSPSFAPDDWLRGDAQKSDLWRRLCVEVDNPDGGYSVDPALAPLQPIAPPALANTPSTTAVALPLLQHRPLPPPPPPPPPPPHGPSPPRAPTTATGPSWVRIDGMTTQPSSSACAEVRNSLAVPGGTAPYVKRVTWPVYTRWGFLVRYDSAQEAAAAVALRVGLPTLQKLADGEIKYLMYEPLVAVPGSDSQVQVTYKTSYSSPEPLLSAQVAAEIMRVLHEKLGVSVIAWYTPFDRRELVLRCSSTAESKLVVRHGFVSVFGIRYEPRYDPREINWTFFA